MKNSFHGIRLSRLSVAEIRALVESAPPDEAFMARLARDPRAGVRALARGSKRKNRAEARQVELLAIERNLRAEGFARIAGIDEAGRGPLAGPVTIGCVILTEDTRLPGLDDSKRLSPAVREEMYGRIVESAAAWSVVVMSHVEIDSLGILGAVLEGMRDSVGRLTAAPDIALVDGNREAGLVCRERTIVDGDRKCLSIAAASVIAKVTRDRIMRELDLRWPGYGFAGHKGYGCESHLEAIRRLGPCEIHRFSFRRVIEDAPPGTVRAALETRLRASGTPHDLECAAAGIRRAGERIGGNDLDRLREVYRECRQRFA
jgi:ribonuclease HII